jgi:hypothetical protein
MLTRHPAGLNNAKEVFRFFKHHSPWMYKSFDIEIINDDIIFEDIKLLERYQNDNSFNFSQFMQYHDNNALSDTVSFAYDNKQSTLKRIAYNHDHYMNLIFDIKNFMCDILKEVCEDFNVNINSNTFFFEELCDWYTIKFNESKKLCVSFPVAAVNADACFYIDNVMTSLSETARNDPEFQFITKTYYQSRTDLSLYCFVSSYNKAFDEEYESSLKTFDLPNCF